MPHSDIFATAVPVSESYQPSPFDGILEKSRDLICQRLDEALAIMLDSAHEVITQLIKDTQIREEWRLYEEAREVATQQRETIEKHFKAAYRADFQRRSDRARKIGKPFDHTAYSLDDLELIGEDDYDETLRFNAMAHKLRNYCEEELSALDQRVGVLLGNAALDSQDNPFSPNVICDAFKIACRQLEATPPVRGVLLRLFDDEVLDEIRSVYKAVNALLVRNAILPQIRYSVGRTAEAPGGRTGAGHAGSALSEPPAGIAAGAPQDLFSMLQNLMAANLAAGGHAAGMAAGRVPAGLAAAQPFAGGSMPVVPMLAAGGAPLLMPGSAPSEGTIAAGEGNDAAHAVAGATALPVGNLVVLQGSELLNRLTLIQQGATIAGADPAEGGDADSPAGSAPSLVVPVAGTANVLHRLKSSDVGAGMNPLDRMTLDIIAMLFDELFDDPKVPNAIKALIGRLQIPMLKVAIADKSFFSTKTHPARKLLDAVGDVALRLPADFNDANPLFARLEALVQHLVDDYRDELAIFTEVRDELLALMAEEDRRIEAEAQEQAKHVEELEQLSLARAAAQKEVLARVRVRELPEPVLKFVAQEWIKLLLLVHAKEGIESEAWSDAICAMDELIWSVEPKRSNEERRKLATLIPGLVKRLTAGLERAGIEDTVRVHFFAELMNYHMQAISAAPRTAGEAAVESHAEQPARAPAERPRLHAVAKPLRQTAHVPLAAISAHGASTNAAAARDASPEPAKAEGRESLDFTAPITVQNPFGAGEVAVDNLDLDFTAEAIEGAKAKREASIRRAIDNLKMGHWLEFRDPDAEGGATKAGRLIFISPQKTRYLFATDRAGREIIQCSRGEIVRRFMSGQAVKLDEPPEEPLFDRIMNGLLSKLRLSGRPPLFAQ